MSAKITSVTLPALRRALLLAFVLALAPLAGCSRPAETPQEPQLLASLSFTRHQLILDNGNDYVWRDVTMTLNRSYTYTTDLLPRGESSIPLAAFRDARGNAFDPGAATPRRLTVDVAQGLDGKSGRFAW